jgi:hypothetical protein
MSRDHVSGRALRTAIASAAVLFFTLRCVDRLRLTAW